MACCEPKTSLQGDDHNHCDGDDPGGKLKESLNLDAAQKPVTPDVIHRYLEILRPNGGLVEIRALDVPGKGKPHIAAGYFDDYDLAAKAAHQLDQQKAAGVYITLNAINPALKARAANRIKKYPKHTTTDSDVMRREWLLVDLDPERLAGTSSSEDEKNAARMVADRCRNYLSERGWPDPLVGDSGNGWHLDYRIDLFNDDVSTRLVQGVLETLAERAGQWQVDGYKVLVDRSVSNAARIVKLYGTTARKGDSLEDRPHRVSRIAEVPADLAVVPIEKLRELIEDKPNVGNSKPATGPGRNGDHHRLDVPRWLEARGVGFRQKDRPDPMGRVIYVLDRCPFNEQHGGSKEVAIMQAADGKMGAICMHAGCTGKGWQEFKASIGEPDPEHYDPPLNTTARLASSPSVLVAQDIDGQKLPEPIPWPELNQDAYQGIAGRIITAIEPETEADTVAILIQFLVAIGNIFGRSAYYFVEGTPHYANLFAVLVGKTARGRKGTSEGRVRQVLRLVDERWADENIQTGLVSGEGLIWSVRDPIYKIENIKEKGRITGTEKVLADTGIEDKRLLVVENEFASTLRVCKRETNTLSPTLRSAWDSGHLRTMAKNSPAKATDAHISVVGHITAEELRSALTEVDGFNGFANRFLWVAVRRSKLLPDGGHDLDLSAFAERLVYAVQTSRTVERMLRDKGATILWRKIYPELADDNASGLLAAVTSRAEAQVLRLSMIYALLDNSTIICEEHLRAAVAVWRYCRQSAELIFGRGGDPLQEKVLDAIRRQPGLGRREIHRATGNHIDGKVLADILTRLRDDEKIKMESIAQPGGGRPTERWFLCEHCEGCEQAPHAQDTCGPEGGTGSQSPQSSRGWSEVEKFIGQEEDGSRAEKTTKKATDVHDHPGTDIE